MSVTPIRIVVVDDDRTLAWELQQALSPEGYEVETYGSAEDALPALTDSRRADAAILDMNLPGRSGLELLDDLRALAPETQAIMLTGHGSIEGAVEATKKGAFAYLTKPPDFEQVRIVLRRALEQRSLQGEVSTLKAELAVRSGPPLLTGTTKAMQEVQDLIRRVAPYDVSVLIIGESGTGKEVVARALHAGSPRAAGPFIAADCGALPEHLMESELFGYEKGAFTGATAAKPGRFQLAHKGTLLLDEVGNLPVHVQAKLLRVLQERTIMRLGGQREEKVDVRIVAATNASLEVAIRQGKFREDLYHRLNQFKVTLPPLRERRADIPVLAQHFLRQYAREFKKPEPTFADAALDVLKRHQWSGNVRELQNVIRHALVLAEKEVAVAHLPEEVVRAVERGSPLPLSPPPLQAADGSGDALDLRSSVDRAERDAVRSALEATGWHQEKSAVLLGVTPKTLSTKMKLFGLRRPKGIAAG